MSNRLVFELVSIPDLSLGKYSYKEISTQQDLIEAQAVILKQLHGICSFYKASVHLLYLFDYGKEIGKGKKLRVYLYFDSEKDFNADAVKPFIENGYLSEYFPFRQISFDTELNSISFKNYCFLTKDKIEFILNQHYGDSANNIEAGIKEWKPNKNGRLYSMLKFLEQVSILMQTSGYKYNAFRVDLFPVQGKKVAFEFKEKTQELYCKAFGKNNSKDHAAEILLNLYLDLYKGFSKNTMFDANIVAFSDCFDVARLMLDYVGLCWQRGHRRWGILC